MPDGWRLGGWVQLTALLPIPTINTITAPPTQLGEGAQIMQVDF